eukprot:scaffold141180_cov23-Tisochrysis_lutea.AAC.2
MFQSHWWGGGLGQSVCWLAGAGGRRAHMWFCARKACSTVAPKKAPNTDGEAVCLLHAEQNRDFSLVAPGAPPRQNPTPQVE